MVSLPRRLKALAAPWILSTALSAFGAAAPVQAQVSPEIEQSFATALVRDALLALHHANVTGNYTVLHDYGARAFRDANDPTSLAMAFARLRAEGLNLLQAAVLDPQFRTSSLSLDRNVMRLSGIIPVEGRRIDFDMEFSRESNVWRLLGLSVGEAPPTPAPAPAATGGQGEDSVEPAPQD